MMVAPITADQPRRAGRVASTVCVPAFLALSLAALVASCGEESTAPEVVPSAPAALEIVSGDGQSVEAGTELAAPLVVRLVDSAGVSVPGHALEFRVTAGRGLVFAASEVTDSDGLGRTRWILGTSTADSQRVEARAPVEAGALSVVFQATVLPWAPELFLKVAGDSQKAPVGEPVADSLVVRAVDPFDNPVPGARVDWTVDPGGSTTPADSETDSLGVARTFWTLGTVAGFYRVTARLGELEPLRFTATATVKFRWVSAGPRHTAALTEEGAVYRWGFDELPIFEGDTFPAIVAGAPVLEWVVSGGSRIVQLGRHSCGVTPAPEPYCWGYNEWGQLGTGDTISRTTPVPVSGGLSFTSMALGWFHTCGVAPDGVAYCWGNNSWGQFGTGDTLSSTLPVRVSETLVFVSVAAGLGHTCGVTVGGEAYCWGLNSDGQLGTGDTLPSLVPVPVSGGLQFGSISSSFTHTCGVATDGAAYCWGDGGDGRLGNGSTAGSATPVPVSGGLAFADVSAGGLHTCGLTTDGAGYCWGRGNAGQLGDDSGAMRTTPVAVYGGLLFTQLTAGWTHSCGIAAGNVAYCWGEGGQKGDGSLSFSLIPVRVAFQP